MRLHIFMFISTSLALLIPRCENGNHSTTSVAGRAAESPSTYPYTKKVKSSKSVVATITPLPTRAASTPVACIPKSVCVDKFDNCGHRYGGCYDQNFCDGNTSPYPTPTCSTIVTKKKAVVAAPEITPA